MLTKKNISRDFKLVRTCSIWRALDDVGDVPCLLILQSIWMGRTRFNEINKIAHLPKAVLSNRLQKLSDAGILAKPSISSSAYRLTTRGLDLFRVVLMLLRWERRWSRNKMGPQVTLTHKTGGRAVTPQPICGHCRSAFSAEDVDWVPGPGIGLMRPVYARRRQRKTKPSEAGVTLLFTESAEILGDRWSALLIRSMLTGLELFDQLLDDTAIATNVLSARLKWLQEIEMVSPALEGAGAYKLTEKGKDFFPVLAMLQIWGDKYYASPEGPPVQFYHRTCTNELSPIIADEESGEAIEFGDTWVSHNPDEEY